MQNHRRAVLVVFGTAHRSFDLPRGRRFKALKRFFGREQHECLHLVTNDLAQLVKRHLFVRTARNHNDLEIIQRKRADHCAGRTRCDGVVIPSHAVQLAHELHAVLDAVEFFRDSPDNLFRDIAPHGRNRRKVVFDVVLAGNANVAFLHNIFVAEVDFAVRAAPRAVRLLSAGEHVRHAARVSGTGRRQGVIRVQNRAAERILVQKYVLLRVHVLVHILVHVEVVRRQIRDDRDIRAAAHGDELEARKLHHRHILGLYITDLRQKRAADVAAEVHGLARRFQHFGNDGRCGRLAVAARHGVNFARTQVEKDFHFARHGNTVCTGLLQLGQQIRHAGRAEQHVFVDTFKVVFAADEVCAELFQRFAVFAQRRFAALIAHRNGCTVGFKLLNERQVGAPHADKRDALAGKRRVKFVCCHNSELSPLF